MKEVLEKRLHVNERGKVVAHEETGIFPPWGGYRAVYTVDKDGKLAREWYADHTCSLNAFGEPVEPSAVPEEVMAILGKPVEQVLSIHGDSFEIVEP